MATTCRKNTPSRGKPFTDRRQGFLCQKDTRMSQNGTRCLAPFGTPLLGFLLPFLVSLARACRTGKQIPYRDHELLRTGVPVEPVCALIHVQELLPIQPGSRLPGAGLLPIPGPARQAAEPDDQKERTWQTSSWRGGPKPARAVLGGWSGRNPFCVLDYLMNRVVAIACLEAKDSESAARPNRICPAQRVAWSLSLVSPPYNIAAVE